jgi:hypothetical protein
MIAGERGDLLVLDMMKNAPLDVIPAKAGIHADYPNPRSWIPAFAGMTVG